MKPIGILGGTFNPIHEGHITIAEHVLQACDLERIEFMPCYRPPHRHENIASPKDRLAMIKLAIQNHPNLSVNDYEIQQRQISYTIKTACYLREYYPERSLCLILGSDAFSHFHEWREWEKILDTVNLIVVSRTETRASPAQNINSAEARAVVLAQNINSSEAGAVALARMSDKSFFIPISSNYQSE